MFYVMSNVCDTYLVPAVDALCARFGIPEDVAGATLVAFACNGPELLCNVCGIFVTKNSVGMGTIVGSAIFNVLAIVGACPLVAPTGELFVNRVYFFRDASFSAVSIVLLWWALPVIDLFRASVLLGMSVLYAVVVAKTETWWGRAAALERRNSTLKEPMLLRVEDGLKMPDHSPLMSPSSFSSWTAASPRVSVRLLAAAIEVLIKPTDSVLALTVPDVRADEAPSVGRMLYAFFTSMAWLSGTAYVVCLGSDAINMYWGVPQGFLGLTLVAVGTSWPNLMASLITARTGRGAMAIGNALGSNVQNIFFVLAAPIWVSVLLSGSYDSNSRDILDSVVWMGITLAIVVGSIAGSGFKLRKMHGWLFVVIYVVYLVQATHRAAA